jgi:hypothetical protein
MRQYIGIYFANRFYGGYHRSIRPFKIEKIF